MHMFSRKDMNSADLETVRVSRSPTTVVTANGEVQTKKRNDRVCRRIGLICDSTASRRYTSHWENSVKITDIPSSGQVASNHKLIKDGRRVKCNTENYVPIDVPGLSTSSSISATPTSPTSVLQEAKHPASTRSESTSCRRMNQQKTKKKKRRHRDRTEKPVAWSARMVRRIYGESCGWKCSSSKGRNRDFFSWISFRAANKSGIGQAQYLYSFPEGQKLRVLHEDQNNEGSLQKTHWHCRTSSRKCWWLDNSRSQSSQWRTWFSKQSSMCCRGTGSGNSMESISSVQN